MKTKALISCAVTAQLICVFVFAYAKSRSFHNEAQLPLRFIFQTMVPLGFLLQPSSPLLLVQLSLSFSCSAAGAAAVLIKEDADSTFIKNVNFDLQGTF